MRATSCLTFRLLSGTRLGKRHNDRDALRAVGAPVLVVHGAQDLLQSEDASRAYAEVFPNAQIRIVEDAGHLPFYSQPEPSAQVVLEFLGGLE